MTAISRNRMNDGSIARQRSDRSWLGPRPHYGRIKGREVRAGRGVRDQWVMRLNRDVRPGRTACEITEYSDSVPLLTMCARKL